jgi:two-component system response regulator DevR
MHCLRLLAARPPRGGPGGGHDGRLAAPGAPARARGVNAGLGRSGSTALPSIDRRPSRHRRRTVRGEDWVPIDRARLYKGGVIRVFLLDDHEVVRRGVADLLTQEGDIEVIGESDSAVEAVELIPTLRPDVAILDVRLPDGSGIDVCRDVRSMDSSIRALILTSYEDALFAAIMAGASGYVLKEVRGSDLVSCLRRIAAGDTLLDPALTERVLARVRAGVSQLEELRTLTPTERRILECMAQNMTNHEIAQLMFLPERVVRAQVSDIMTKLGLKRRSHAARVAARLLKNDPPTR